MMDNLVLLGVLWVSGTVMCSYDNLQLVKNCLKGGCDTIDERSVTESISPSDYVTYPISPNDSCISLEPLGEANREGWTALHEAAHQGRPDVVECRVEAGADVNAGGHSGIALHLAAKHGHLGMVKYLVEKGSRIETEDAKRSRPLQLAAQYGHTPVVKYLLDKNAEIDHGHGWTALHHAASSGNEEMAKLLADRGGNVNAMTEDGTPVHLAAIGGHLEVLKMLLDHEGKVNLRDKLGNTPLQLAAWHGHTSTVKYLLRHGALPNTTNKEGWTPLHQAASQGHLEIAKLLVENGANLKARDKDGATAFIIARQRNNLPIVRYLETKV